MAREIERKFLVKGDEWRKDVQGIYYLQGYLATGSGCTVRVRVSNQTALLTIKGSVSKLTRREYEYQIPVSDGDELLNHICLKPIIKKTRYVVEYGGVVWEVDEFDGDNKGLVIAEVEMNSENQQIQIPNWVGMEVSGNPKFYNANLVKHPFSHWESKG